MVHARPTTRWASCECERCTRLRLRTQKLARLGMLPRPRSAEAWAEIDRCLAAGWSPAAIASASHLPVSTVDNAIRLREQTGRASTWSYGIAERLIGRGEPARGEVSAVPPQRRLRALAVTGWTLGTLADISGLGRRTLTQIRSGEVDRVKALTAQAIGELYDDISLVPGASAQAAAEARGKGWIGPLGWDDIEDLTEDPASAAVGEGAEGAVDPVAVDRAVSGAAQGAAPLTAGERALAVERMTRSGLADPAIAERLGVSRRTVLRIRQEEGIPAARG